MPGLPLQVFVLLQQLVSQSVRKLEDRIDQVNTDLTDKLVTLQKKLSDKSDSLELRIDNKLNLFENRVEDKIDNQNILNELTRLDSKVSADLAKFRIEAKVDIRNSFDALRQTFKHDQGEALKNAFEQFEKTFNEVQLSSNSMARESNWLNKYNQLNLQIVRNETEAIREMLTSGEVLSQCLRNDAMASIQEYLPLQCERDMRDYTENTTSSKYAVVPQSTIHRDILCDTQTDGGGWTVIQRRTKGDVFFNRDWESHKNGFGQVDGDFWLGNDAVHILTY
ncbi:hypothetical protein EGW08_000420, partial [Elysia chlorotica]